MGDGSQVDYRRDGKVGIITISREPLNTYDDAFEHEFQQAWIWPSYDDSRVVVGCGRWASISALVPN